MRYRSFEHFLMESQTTIRVSCAALARIQIGDRFLFILNKNSVKTGKPTYGPLGGALEFHASAKDFLDKLEVTYEKGVDLRLVMPEKNLPMYLDWFYKRSDREITSLREVYEELVLEEKILDLSPDQMAETYIKTVTEEKLSNRLGQEGVRTRAVYEIFDVVLPKKSESDILAYLSNPSNNKLLLLSKQEVTTDPRLGSHSQHIL